MRLATSVSALRSSDQAESRMLEDTEETWAPGSHQTQPNLHEGVGQHAAEGDAQPDRPHVVEVDVVLDLLHLHKLLLHQGGALVCTPLVLLHTSGAGPSVPVWGLGCPRMPGAT